VTLFGRIRRWEFGRRGRDIPVTRFFLQEQSALASFRSTAFSAHFTGMAIARLKLRLGTDAQ
jgi:hypothetical protein